jgi:hypothetical protein
VLALVDIAPPGIGAGRQNGPTRVLRAIQVQVIGGDSHMKNSLALHHQLQDTPMNADVNKPKALPAKSGVAKYLNFCDP